MKEPKPDWYARLRKGPFEGPSFDAKMEQAVEARAIRGGGGSKRKRRPSRWAAAAAVAALLIAAVLTMPGLRGALTGIQAAGGPDGDEMTAAYVTERLSVGLREDEVVRQFGKRYEGMSVRRDFASPHAEDPVDMGTWSAVDTWRYDYGVREGYSVQSDLDRDDGFDVPALENGQVASQLLVVWRDGKVDRAIFKYGTDQGIATALIGPQATSEAMPEATPSRSEAAEKPPEYPSLKVRAIGESELGRLELRKDDGMPERIQTLGAPSCLGQETDFEISGSYSVYFLPAAGGETRIDSLPTLEIIQKDNVAFAMRKFDFPQVEVFLLIPRYADCHGLEFRAYGIDKKSGDAFAFSFRDGEQQTWPEWTTSPGIEPSQTEDELVIVGGSGGGRDVTLKYRFLPDAGKHELKLTSQEQAY